MGKITDALKKATQERMTRIEKLDQKEEVKYQFIAKKTAESKIDPRVVTFYDGKSAVSEQYRMLRTHLQALKTKSSLQALTFTSSVHSEGKTITALNLAIATAHDLNKKKILLVDADMRRGKVSKYLGLSPEAGLAEYLSDGISLDEVLLDIGIENLTILPAGKTPQNPAELLNSRKFTSFVATLKERFDHIIIDTPPIVSVTDAGVIGAQTDGVVMVVKAGSTQKGVINHARSLLAQSHVKLLGFVLTNIEYHVPAYLYRYL